MLIAVARAKKKLRERIPSGQRRLGKRLAGPRKSGKKFGLESCTRHSQGMEARKERGREGSFRTRVQATLDQEPDLPWSEAVRDLRTRSL